MKLNKKKVVVVALALSLVAILSLGTLAWFNAQDSVTNEFQISDSLTSFDIDVWEKVPDGDDEGTELDEIGKGNTQENSYKYEDLMPGDLLDKQVYVENTSGNSLTDQYVKVEVTFTNYAALNAISDNGLFDCKTMLKGTNFSDFEDDDTTDWYYSNCVYNENENTATYVFYLRETLAYNDAPVVLFEQVEIPANMDIDDVVALSKNGFNINVVAYAIQSANISEDGNTTLENAIYAFGTPWAEKDTAPADPVFPEVE